MHNNQSYYNSEEHGIEVAKFRKRPVENAPIGTHVDDPAIDFAMMAKSFGVNSEGPVRNPADLRPAIERGVKYVKRSNCRTWSKASPNRARNLALRQAEKITLDEGHEDHEIRKLNFLKPSCPSCLRGE